MMPRLFIVVFLLLFVSNNYAWNSLGHQLVAQIAYDNLSPSAKKLIDRFNHDSDVVSSSTYFVKNATWLDRIRYHDVHWFDSLHYINTPFSKDETPLPPISNMNVVWGIQQALAVLSSPKSSQADKRLSLKILTHLVGDIHQPLHTITRVSQEFPKGDLGGNLFILARNPIGDNLHKYWDNGAGVLIGPSKIFQVRNKALQLEKKWSCQIPNKTMNPTQWIKESHELALNHAYTVSMHSLPNKKYQLQAQTISQKQILSAGCRLAFILNDIVKTPS